VGDPAGGSGNQRAQASGLASSCSGAEGGLRQASWVRGISASIIRDVDIRIYKGVRHRGYLGIWLPAATLPGGGVAEPG